ncbi:MAG: nucleotide sugar dehydrogenase [Verrucomicrobia bacterium]|nr:nucleotide sugar dehydrogenase [Verrucomicrobiota bacterium]
MQQQSLRIAVVGGGGHVGLPLSLLLAQRGFAVSIMDCDAAKIELLKRGEFPFLEQGGPELLRSLHGSPLLRFTTDSSVVAEVDVIILVTGTPVDEHLNPHLGPVFGVMDQIRPCLRAGQTIILRSTLFPGTSEKIYQTLSNAGLGVGVCFCPERVAQGHALKELTDLPQIISGSDARALGVARQVFSTLTRTLVELSMTEAELAKLFTNSWRYIRFAVANQFYMIAQEKGLDFYRIHEAMGREYARAADLPAAGFAAGPCLFKDTMQLAAFNRQNFALGQAAMLVNETLPDFLVEQVKRAGSLAGKTVGILGMAFKPNNDDKRESLAYKLRKLLVYEGAQVLCTDPYIRDADFVPLETVLKECEILFIGCPHSEYRRLKFPGKRVVDCWNMARP